MMKMKRCLIVTGGTIDIAFAKDFLSQRSYDYVIAADAGLEVCLLYTSDAADEL